MSDKVAGCCDLVMKGGVTSGVVYLQAIKEIAKRFHLVGIGGTSAGAIGASIAAAAEYRRRESNSFEGFEMLDDVVAELKKPERLLTLFRPDHDTAQLFDLAMSFLEGRAGLGRKVGLGWRLRSEKARKKLLEPLVNNGFGVCTGMAGGTHPGEPPLTPWLTNLIDRVAGKDAGDHLTFKDLHNAKLPSGFEQDFTGKTVTRSIDLRAVATSLTFNRPFEFPLDTNTLAFDPEEFSRLFPQSVVEQMRRASAQIESGWLVRDGKMPLPNDDLPIVVPTRMSLSFPVLFSLVPLWAANFHKPDGPLEPVWISDGGITSNFPVHRFDSIYPRWPTLALNLQSMGSDDAPQRASLKRSGGRVYLPGRRSDGTQDLWHEFVRPSEPVGSLLAFVGVIFGSAQNWHDNAFLKLPGFRDRIAEVWLSAAEGGLNLNMDEARIDALIARGRQAGAQIASRYADLPDSDDMSWAGHRWTRFRSGMAGLVDAVIDFGESLEPGGLAATDVSQFLAEADPATPPCYKFRTNAQRDAARKFTEAVAELVNSSREDKPFSEGPRPAVTFGSRAPI